MFESGVVQQIKRTKDLNEFSFMLIFNPKLELQSQDGQFGKDYSPAKDIMITKLFSTQTPHRDEVKETRRHVQYESNPSNPIIY